MRGITRRDFLLGIVAMAYSQQWFNPKFKEYLLKELSTTYSKVWTKEQDLDSKLEEFYNNIISNLDGTAKNDIIKELNNKKYDEAEASLKKIIGKLCGYIGGITLSGNNIESFLKSTFKVYKTEQEVVPITDEMRGKGKEILTEFMFYKFNDYKSYYSMLGREKFNFSDFLQSYYYERYGSDEGVTGIDRVNVLISVLKQFNVIDSLIEREK